MQFLTNSLFPFVTVLPAPPSDSHVAVILLEYEFCRHVSERAYSDLYMRVQVMVLDVTAEISLIPVGVQLWHLKVKACLSAC